MSFEAITWALAEGQRRELEPPQRFLLMLMGSLADPSGGTLYPSHGYLAARTGMSRATIKRHMKALEDAGLVAKETRRREKDGSQTSNGYQLAMQQADLNLPPPVQIEPRSKSSPGSRLRPAPQSTAVTPHEGKEEGGTLKATPAEGAKPAPTATSACWQAYAEAMKARYGVEPPRNAKANGQLAQIVGRVGAEGALQLVKFYVAHPDRFYGTVSHSLDYLVRDCDKRLWIEMNKQAGGRAAPAATKAEVKFEYEGGGTRTLQDYPLGQPIDIARKCKQDYGRMVASTSPKNIVVQIGQQAHRYSLAELDQGRTA